MCTVQEEKGGMPAETCGQGRLSRYVVQVSNSCRETNIAFTQTAEKLDPTDDRVSIKALLNGGTDTFTQTFNLPPSDLRVKSLQFHQKNHEPEETTDTTNLGLGVSPESFDYSGMFESFIDMNEQYLDFWNGPFGLIPSPNYSDLQLDFYDPSNMSGEMRHGPTPSDSTPNPPDQAQYVSSVNMAIYNKLWCLALDDKTRQELTSCLNFLLTPDKIPKFISMYFRNWHLNCPMLHKLSFDPSKVPITLVISVVFVGAMYSKDHTERLAAKKLVDIAELVVFDSEIFSFDTEIVKSMQEASTPPQSAVPDASQDNDWQTFQELQAGFLMVIAQYWAGTRIPKRRALESRLGEVIKVFTSVTSCSRIKLTHGSRSSESTNIIMRVINDRIEYRRHCGCRRSHAFGKSAMSDKSSVLLTML